MAWSTSAPTLPAGSAWAQVGTTSVETNNLKITSTIYAARLDGNGFAVRVTETRTFYKSYFDQTYHRCDIGGVTGTAYTGSWPANSGDTVSYYFTGEAAAGASITVTVGRQADSTGDMKASTFAAPALLGPTVYIKVGGKWKQAASVYIRVSGAWKDALAKINIGGSWK